MESKMAFERGEVTDRNAVLMRADLPLELLGRGKVRDTYVLDEKRLLMVTTDRISVFDRVLPDGIPQKGRILNQMSTFWFNRTKEIIPNHVISEDIADSFPESKEYERALYGRSVIVKHAEPLEFECITRGYLTGSGLADYNRTGAVCGIELPKGLIEASKLDEPIFTPSTKAKTGHDQNVPFEKMEESLGSRLAGEMKSATLKIYKEACTYAEQHGVIIADTKLEFGILDGKLIAIDEMLTPDSSRYWLSEGYAPGKVQPSLDKQPVRDYVKRTWGVDGEWSRLPEQIIEETTGRYREIHWRITGHDLKGELRI